MSTHIYSTFISPKGSSVFQQFIEQCEKNKDKNRESYIDIISKEISDSILFEAGLVIFKNYPDFIKLLNNHYHSRDKEFSRLFANEKVSIVLYDTSETKIVGKGLCQTFMPENFWLKKELKEKFKDFDYTNSTDMSDISRSSYLLRRKVWDQIFKTSSIPSVAGVSFDLYNFLDELQENFNELIDKIGDKVIKNIQEADFKNAEEKVYVQIKLANHEKEMKELEFNKVMSFFLDCSRKYREEYENSKSLNEVETKKMNLAKENFDKMKNEIGNIKELLVTELEVLLKESIEVTNEYNKKMDDYFNKVNKLK